MPSVASEQQWKISLGNEHTGRKRLYMHLPSKIIHGFDISGIPTSQQVNIMQQTAVLKLRNYSFYNYQYVLCWYHVYLLDKSQFSCTKQIKDLYFQQHTTHTHARMHTHTHTHTLNGPLSGKIIWILEKQETVSGSGISWATICKSAHRFRQITMPAPHHSVFTGQMPFQLPNQQCQSTKGTRITYSCLNNR